MNIEVCKEVVREDSLFVHHNIYNEKEDFMWLLFGVDITSQETIDYWREKQIEMRNAAKILVGFCGIF